MQHPRKYRFKCIVFKSRSFQGKTCFAFIFSIEEWDHRFHGINEVEAELVDPQQRIVLDCVHMALEDGGLTKKDIDGTNTGVYIGNSF
jgi:acyl transferase domain-containing protein